MPGFFHIGKPENLRDENPRVRNHRR
jgi:hypothetical protein